MWLKQQYLRSKITAGQISTDALAWPHQLCLFCTTSGRTDTCLLVHKSVSTRLLSSQSYKMQQKPGPLSLPTSKLWKPSTWSVRDSCCRSAGNSLSEMTRSQRLPACRRSQKSLAAVVALFGHVARLQQDVPAYKALHCHVDLSLGRPPNDQWKRRPGQPRERWYDQVRKDNGIPPVDLWRRATSRGHRGATLQPTKF